MIGAQCTMSAQENQKRRIKQGLPPCGRLMDPSCRFREDISHAVDLICERRALFRSDPQEELALASLLARIHGIGTSAVTEAIERELFAKLTERRG